MLHLKLHASGFTAPVSFVTTETTFSEGDFVYFRPNLDGTRKVVEQLYNVYDGSVETVWARPSVEKFTSYVLIAASVYHTLTNGRFHTLSGKRHTPALAREAVNLFPVSRYVRDLIRELCRPMEHDGIVYIPDLPLVDKPRGNTLTEYLASLVGDSSFNDVHRVQCRASVFPATVDDHVSKLVEVGGETLDPVSLSIFLLDEERTFIWSVTQLPTWRASAFRMLRHLRMDSASFKQEKDEKKGKERKGSSGERVLLKTALDKYPVRMLNSFELSDRYFNHSRGFILPERREIFVLSGRFPTDESHSRTPTKRRGDK